LPISAQNEQIAAAVYSACGTDFPSISTLRSQSLSLRISSLRGSVVRDPSQKVSLVAYLRVGDYIELFLLDNPDH